MSDDTPAPEEPSAAEPSAEPAEPSAPPASAAKPVSFQTASGKAVSFTASSGKRTKKAKVVVEAPVEEPPPEPPELKRSSAAQSVEAVPEAPPEALPEPEKKPRGRPKGSTKKPAPGIQERLPPKQPITEVAPLPATPEPPAYPRMTQGEFHGLMTEYMQTSRSQRRDARLALYRSLLST